MRERLGLDNGSAPALFPIAYPSRAAHPAARAAYFSASANSAFSARSSVTDIASRRHWVAFSVKYATVSMLSPQDRHPSRLRDWPNVTT
jgi:hypothetical protein